jgi:hypothetical protein
MVIANLKTKFPLREGVVGRKRSEASLNNRRFPYCIASLSLEVLDDQSCSSFSRSATIF